MRVLFLVSRDWTNPQATGGDAHTCDYARYLAGRGHSVTLIASRYRGSSGQETLEGVQILRPGRLFFLAFHTLLYYLGKRGQFDVVFEEGMASVRIPFLAPLYVHGPLVSIWYQINRRIFFEQYTRLVAYCLGFVERLVLGLHHQCLIVTPTEDRRSDFVALGWPPDQVIVLPPMMLDSRPPLLAVPSREKVVAWVGKIRRYKCAHHVVQAFPEVLRLVPDAQLVIAGRRDADDYEAELLKLGKRLGLGTHFQLCTNISDLEKWQLLARSRALAVTSPLEGFGIVIVEANQCGTPVVVTDGVPTDTGVDGLNAVRVPFGDRKALAQALIRLLCDDRLFDRLSQNASKFAGKFSVEAIGSRLEDTLGRARAGRRNAAGAA